MTYGPGQDEDLDQWIAQQAALSSLLEPESQMPAYQAPPHAEMPELKLDTGPDWSDALGAGTTLLASLADLGFNKGRGTGQILAAGGQFAQARGEQRLRQTQEALNYEEKRAALDRQNKYNDYLYANMAQRGQQGAVKLDQAGQRIDISAQNAGTKAKGEARQTRKEDRDTNPESDYRDAFADALIKQGMATSAELKNLSYEQMKADYGAMARKWELEHAGEKAQASRGGTIAADVENADVLGDVKADQARKVAEATEPVSTRKIEAGAVAKARAERAAAGEKTYANVDVVDPAVVSSLNTKQVNDLNEISRSKVQFEKAMNDMTTIQKRAGGFEVLPGKDKAAWETAQSAAIGSLTSLFQTGVINEQEYKRYVERIPGPGISLGGMTGKMGEIIGATRDELSGIFDAGLSQYGVRGKRAGAPPPAVGPQNSPSMAPGQFDVPGNLGVMGTRNPNSVPPIPQQAGGSLPSARPNPDGTFTLPGGRRPYQAHEVQRLIQMGKLAPL